MSCGITTKTTMWSTAVEYFRVFQRGLNSSDEMQLVDLNILKTAMAPDLDAGTVRGFKNLVKSWKVFSNAFQEVRVQLGRLDQTSETSLMATTTTSITITENSLTTMFPYLSARVAAKILGHRLVLRGSMLFEWDSINNHVARLSFQADMMSPILELLGNLEDVSLVFTDARIRPDCNLVNEV
ncbi:hypothetical protein PHMEG_0008254 [Phytophthora megakarya]|uniref:Bzip transcription factor n=1 Tax=Phytophthora megakarya TaxID=4795 RepID=A0A225WK19_9STRA|nr:hypothetical protein PHMEG_0008254 [Phytophthora megakarya]